MFGLGGRARESFGAKAGDASDLIYRPDAGIVPPTAEQVVLVEVVNATAQAMRVEDSFIVVDKTKRLADALEKLGQCRPRCTQEKRPYETMYRMAQGFAQPGGTTAFEMLQDLRSIATAINSDKYSPWVVRPDQHDRLKRFAKAVPEEPTTIGPLIIGGVRELMLHSVDPAAPGSRPA